MQWRLATQHNGEWLYLADEGPVWLSGLTPHKEKAKVFLSESSAESARDKWHKKRKKVKDHRQLVLQPIPWEEQNYDRRRN